MSNLERNKRFQLEGLVEVIKDAFNDLERLGYHVELEQEIVKFGTEDDDICLSADGSPEQINGPDRGPWGVVK